MRRGGYDPGKRRKKTPSQMLLENIKQILNEMTTKDIGQVPRKREPHVATNPAGLRLGLLIRDACRRGVPYRIAVEAAVRTSQHIYAQQEALKDDAVDNEPCEK